MTKNSPAMRESWVQFLGWEDPPEKEMAIHPSILAWRIPVDRGALPGAGILYIECILHIECSTSHSIIFQDLESLNWNSITAGSQREELRP